MSEAVLEFEVPGRAPATSSPNARINWRVKFAEGREFGALVQVLAQLAGTGAGPYTRAHVTVTQRAMRLRDHDNFIASFKPGLDAIVRAGIILDDNPGCIDLTIRAEKVAHRADESVRVRVERTG